MAMREDIDIEGVWHIPTDPREKGTAGSLKLPEAWPSSSAAKVRIKSYVLAAGGDTYIQGQSKRKALFDSK